MKILLSLTLALVTAFTAAAAQRLQLDRARSGVEVLVKATASSFTARLSEFESEVVYEPTTGHIEQASFDFRFTALETGEAGRDRHLQDWQQTSLFPTAHFELSSFDAQGGGKHQARGQLTLHGVTHEVVFPVVVVADDAHLAIDGEVVLDTRDYDLKVIRKFGLLKVDPQVRVRFHLQGRLTPGRAEVAR